MRWSIELTWVSAPSAVCTTEMPSWAFWVACLETRDLLVEVLADDQTRRVVGGPVDAVARRELLEAARQSCRWWC